MYKGKKALPSVLFVILFLLCMLIIYSNIKITDLVEISENFYTNYNEVELAMRITDLEEWYLYLLKKMKFKQVLIKIK